MENKSNSGLTFTGMLTILFIGLKLTGYIDWSWWWILSPIWITMIIVLTALLVAVIYPLIDAYIQKRKRNG